MGKLIQIYQVELFSVLVHNGISLSRRTNGSDQAAVKPLSPQYVGNFKYFDSKVFNFFL